MDSKKLAQFLKGLSKWYPFDDQGMRNAPEKQGIYILRRAGGKKFRRLKGESDIMYIGSATGEGGLKVRLMQYLNPGPTQLTNLRIHKIATRYKMEVAWYPCDEPKNLEHQLLQQYALDHDELPPLNHARPRLLKKVLFEQLRLKPSLEKTKANRKES